jgi:site-specific DNA recombinase
MGLRLLQVARLSRVHDDSSSLDKQDAQCRRWAEGQGHEIIATAADANVSGKTDPFERPELGPWLTEPHLIDSYDGVIAAKLDRYARSLKYWVHLLDWAKQRGKTVICVEPYIDFSTPTGQLVGVVMSWLAEQELAQITQRIKDTNAYLRANGYTTGKAPFGYMIVPDRDHKIITPHPETAPLLRQAVELYLDGATLRQVAEWLDDNAPSPQGGQWLSTSVSQMFRNPILIGRQVDDKGRTIHRVDPIIDRDMWSKIQSRQSARAKTTGKPPKSLLTGIAVCGHCDGPMYRLASTVKGAKYTYYRCHGTDRAPSTCRNMIRLELLDAKVDDRIMNTPFGKTPETELFVVAGSGHEAEIEEVEHDLRDLDYDDPKFLEKQSALLAERKRLQEAPQTPDIVQEIPTGRTTAEVWAELDTDGRREFLLKHKMVVRVTKGEEPEIFFKDVPEVVIDDVAPGRISIKTRPLSAEATGGRG